jgi:hypothetical protein
MTRLSKHKCQNDKCSNIAEKDKYGNYKRYCCIECRRVSQSAKIRATYANKDIDAIKEKRQSTNLARYGVANVSQSDFVKDKLRNTTAASADIRTSKTKANNLRKYGVESTNSLQSVKDKKKKSFMEKYGVDHQLKIPGVAASVAQKNSDNARERLDVAKAIKLDVYGDENYNNRTKYKETCIERFGVENPSQNAEIHEKKIKTGYRTKKFTFPSGKVVSVQGYEDTALQELLKIYHENDIITETTKIPSITYIGTDNKNHVYFPDIYIPKDNLLIEVKSEYTYRGFIGWLETNLLKQKSCISAGYNHRFMIMGKK